jgi:hypothetical protein
MNKNAPGLPPLVPRSRPQRPSIHDLNGRYMPLDYVPHSEQARNLCRVLAAALAQANTRRKNRRGDQKQRELEDAVAAVVADLLIAQARGGDGWCYRSLHAASFTGEAVSFRTFIAIMKTAEQQALIDRVEGYFDRVDDGEGGEFRRGKASRYRATDTLRGFAGLFGITPDNIDQHFIQALPAHPLELRTASEWLGNAKIPGEKMPFKTSPETQRLEADLHELNQFLDRADIVMPGPPHRGFRRIFSDQPGFAWDKGGRLWSPYHQLPGEERAKITISGEPVVEIDVSASQLTILHGLLGRPFDPGRDPYAVPHIPRPVVKKLVTIIVGKHAFPRDWSEQARADLAADVAETDLDRLFPLLEVLPVVLHYLPILKDYPDQPLTCFDLMFSESEAILGTMLELMRVHRVPSLSVHDSLIVPVSQSQLAQALLKQQYKRVCGIEAALKVEQGGQQEDAESSR